MTSAIRHGVVAALVTLAWAQGVWAQATRSVPAPNNIGFRNDHEQQLVLAGRLRFGGALIGGDPAGLVFRSSRERLGWLLLQRKELDHQEAETMWQIARDEYERCRNARGSSCREPGPPPR